jgi:cell division protein FtsW (lipid II flippase)
MYLHSSKLPHQKKNNNNFFLKNKAVWAIAKFGSFLLWVVASSPSLTWQNWKGENPKYQKTLVGDEP